jgi:hypothetical protein
MTTATVQLAFVGLDALRDDLTPAEVAAVEARVVDDDRQRERHATPARPCRCPKPWVMRGDVCVKCGRDVRS